MLPCAAFADDVCCHATVCCCAVVQLCYRVTAFVDAAVLLCCCAAVLLCYCAFETVVDVVVTVFVP